MSAWGQEGALGPEALILSLSKDKGLCFPTSASPCVGRDLRTVLKQMTRPIRHGHLPAQVSANRRLKRANWKPASSFDKLRMRLQVFGLVPDVWFDAETRHKASDSRARHLAANRPAA